MNDYISREAGFEILQSRLDSISQMSYLNMDWHELDIMRNAIEDAINDIGKVPAADVQPIVYAHKTINVGRRSYCSNCGKLAIMEDFCSKCGAKVKDGEQNEYRKS